MIKFKTYFKGSTEEHIDGLHVRGKEKAQTEDDFQIFHPKLMVVPFTKIGMSEVKTGLGRERQVYPTEN